MKLMMTMTMDVEPPCNKLQGTKKKREWERFTAKSIQPSPISPIGVILSGVQSIREICMTATSGESIKMIHILRCEMLALSICRMLIISCGMQNLPLLLQLTLQLQENIIIGFTPSTRCLLSYPVFIHSN